MDFILKNAFGLSNLNICNLNIYMEIPTG